jgi:hypothetical protein
MLEIQRQQLLQERQQFQLEQIKSTELKHRQSSHPTTAPSSTVHNTQNPIVNINGKQQSNANSPPPPPPPPQTTTTNIPSHSTNGNETHMQSEESTDSQQSDASPAPMTSPKMLSSLINDNNIPDGKFFILNSLVQLLAFILFHACFISVFPIVCCSFCSCCMSIDTHKYIYIYM